MSAPGRHLFLLTAVSLSLGGCSEPRTPLPDGPVVAGLRWSSSVESVRRRIAGVMVDDNRITGSLNVGAVVYDADVLFYPPAVVSDAARVFEYRLHRTGDRVCDPDRLLSELAPDGAQRAREVSGIGVCARTHGRGSDSDGRRIDWTSRAATGSVCCQQTPEGWESTALYVYATLP